MAKKKAVKKSTKKTVKQSGYPYTTVLLFQTLIITIVGTVAMLTVLKAWRVKEAADNAMLQELRTSVTQIKKELPVKAVTKAPVRR
jgi:hypothetical protein